MKNLNFSDGLLSLGKGKESAEQIFVFGAINELVHHPSQAYVWKVPTTTTKPNSLSNSSKIRHMPLLWSNQGW